ncbi:hypothetical protein JW756_05245 [Candidatus Woesearchaeota archaeon]|nr:hypothetical protein [Candidatus Woesearchaeota archaeon]
MADQTATVVYKGDGDNMNVVTIEYGKSNPSMPTSLRVGPDLIPVDDRYTTMLDDTDVSRSVGSVLETYLSEARQSSAAEEDKPKIKGARDKLQGERLLVTIQNGARVSLTEKISNCLGIRTAKIYTKIEGATDTPVFNAKGEVDEEASKWRYVQTLQCNIADLVLGQDQKGGSPQTYQK